MLILGIETSCDETAAAIVQDGKKILSNVVLSQVDKHKIFGGVVPEIASRLHEETLIYVIEEAIKEAGLSSLSEVEAVAVVNTPGLIGSLLVGLNCAKSIALVYNKPLIGINHLYAHIYSVVLENQKGVVELNAIFPCVALVVSGGHTALFYCESPSNVKLIGRTTDDAAGEAFDKIANMLKLPYPGGPEIEKLAKKFKERNTKINVELLFKKPNLNDPNFSFSGLKTAVLYSVYGKNISCPNRIISDVEKESIAAQFQEVITDIIVGKTIKLADKLNVGNIVVTGGVACNELLRQKFLGYEGRYNVFIPPKFLCTDNAAMVAGLGHYLYVNQREGKKFISYSNFDDLLLDAFA